VALSGMPITMLSDSRLFKSLHERDLQAVLSAARQRQAPRGAFFFHQGDAAHSLYLLSRGRVKLAQVTPEGHQVILAIVGPGEMLGGIAALGDDVYSVSAEAADDCCALVWDGKTMARLLEDYPRIATNALWLLAERVRMLQERYVELATERVERRVARTLLRLARHAGRMTDGGLLIDLRLSRQDLAEMTGTTLYTISRILSRWEQQGLVESGRERVLIRYPHGLVSIAEDWPADTAASAIPESVLSS
jgi:CRP-like cAMP-binding protein